LGKVTEDLTNYRVFGTIREPISLYKSIYNFSLTRSHNHIWRSFKDKTLEGFCKRLANLEPSNKSEFRSYFGFPAKNLAKLDYGWATFSYIHYFSYERKFKHLDSNTMADIFLVGPDLVKQLEAYLGMVGLFPKKPINRTKYREQDIDDRIQNLITNRDQFIYQKFNIGAANEG
jgi:hypothetical protein